MFRPDLLIQQYLQSICQMLGTRRRQCPNSSGQTWVPSTWIYNLVGSEIIRQYVYMSIFAVVAQSLSCVWLFWDSTDCSPPGSSVHGISQARILEWVAISFSRGSSWTRDRTHVSCIGRWILYQGATWEAHMSIYNIYKCSKGGKKKEPQPWWGRSLQSLPGKAYPSWAERSLGTWSQVKRGQREQPGKRTRAGGLLGPFGEWLGQQVVGTEFVAEKESGGKKATVTCTHAHPWTFYT